MSKLIIISGSEATGKSAIRDELFRRLGTNYLSKDIIKEKMFDEGTASTWNYSWYERRAKKELFRQIKDYLDSKQDFIIETNFKNPDAGRLKKLLNDDVKVYEIFCATKGLISFRRFVKRNESGARHHGHHDRRWYLTVFIYTICRALRIKWPYKPMGISDKILLLDTSNLSKIDYESITEFITAEI